MPRWRASRRGRTSRRMRQGPAFRARPTDNRAGLAKSRPCALRRAIPPRFEGEERERKTGEPPRPSKQTGAGIALAKRTSTHPLPFPPSWTSSGRADETMTQAQLAEKLGLPWQALSLEHAEVQAQVDVLASELRRGRNDRHPAAVEDHDIVGDV